MVRTRASSGDRPETRRSARSKSPPAPRGSPRSAHPRLTTSPSGDERARKTNEFVASKTRAKAYRESLRTTQATTRGAAARGVAAAAALADGGRGRARDFARDAGWLDHLDDDDGPAPPPPAASFADEDVSDEELYAAAATKRERRLSHELMASELMFPGGSGTPRGRASPSPEPEGARFDPAAARAGLLVAVATAVVAVLLKKLWDAYVAASASAPGPEDGGLQRTFNSCIQRSYVSKEASAHLGDPEGRRALVQRRAKTSGK